MKTRIAILSSSALLFAFGCAGSITPPTQQLADVQAANRSAVELGAQTNPNAQLHLKLAEEQLTQAKAALEDDDNAKADRLLTRAKADAELAVALTRKSQADQAATNAVDQSSAQGTANKQGATP